MTYELHYPSGHKQIWRRVEVPLPSMYLYECLTLSPDGDPLEFRIMSPEQLKRTMRRVGRSGGRIIERLEG